jgi:hypothetical protein
LSQGRIVAETILSESKDVLFPQTRAGPNGRYLAVYEEAAASGSEIALRDLTHELQVADK